MAKAEAIFNGHFDYQGALAEYEQVLSFKAQIDPALYGLALFKSAWCYWRLGNNDEAAKRFVGVFEATDDSGGGKHVSAAERKQLDELQEEALRYVVEVFTEDEKNTAQDLYNFLTKIGGERFSGKIVRRLAEQYFDQAHYERGIEAYELLLKLEPTSRDAGKWLPQIAAGYAAIEDYPHLKSDVRSRDGRVHRGRPVVTHAGRPANVKRHHRGHRSGAAGRRAVAPREGAERQDERRGVRGRRGPVRHLPVEVRRSRRRTRCTSRSAEIDFFRLGQERRRGHALHGRGQGDPGEREERTARDHASRRAVQRARRPLARHGRPAAGRRRARTTSPSRREADKKYAEALDLYAQYYPNDPQLPAMFYRQGQYYFDNANYDSAVKIWGMLHREVPRAASSRATPAKASSSRSIARRTTRTSRRGRDGSRRCRRFAGAKQQERLDALIVAAVFKQGEQKAAAGDHAAAARAPTCAPRRSSRMTRARPRPASTPSRRRSSAATSRRCRRPRSSRWARSTATSPSRPAAHGSRRRRCRRWASSPTPPTSPSRWRAWAIATTRTTRSSSTRRTRPTTPSSCARRPASTIARVLDGNKFLADLRRDGRGRRGRVPDGARRTRTPDARRTRRSSTSATSRARRTSTTARRAWCCSRRRRSRIGDERGAAASLDERRHPRQEAQPRPHRRGQVRRGARPLHAGRARPREVRADPESRATSSSSRRASSRRPSCSRRRRRCSSTACRSASPSGRRPPSTKSDICTRHSRRRSATLPPVRGQDRGPEGRLPGSDRRVRRAHGGAQPRRVRERMEEGG